ncbi:MAG: hypothetical protein U5R30_14035 [Deltaproteobacteria bacterium]|nr:hypothetical protein [Deltaproteobacteria bacterium]
MILLGIATKAAARLDKECTFDSWKKRRRSGLARRQDVIRH